MADATQAPTIDRGNILLRWTFPEFAKYRRSRAWYIWSAVVIGGLLLYALLTRNFLFAVIIVMVVVIFGLRFNREPRAVSVEVSESGLAVGGNFFPYRDLKNFWIAYEPPDVKKLYVEFSAGLRPTLSLSLEDQNPLRVRQVLLQYLPEDLSKEDELLSERLARLFKL